MGSVTRRVTELRPPQPHMGLQSAVAGRGKNMLLQPVLLEWGWVCREGGDTKRTRHLQTQGWGGTAAQS